MTGICHARGSNAELPAGWLIYITVADVDDERRTLSSHKAARCWSNADGTGRRALLRHSRPGRCNVAALYQP